MNCRHVMSANPRFEQSDGSHTCVKCGKSFTPEVMERDRVFEERCLREAASSLGLQHVADALHAFADRRAHDGPVRLGGRDLVQEAVEEIGDLTSYVTWALQSEQDDDDHERTAALWEALQYAVLTFNALRKA